jgi:hypothetical protein
MKTHSITVTSIVLASILSLQSNIALGDFDLRALFTFDGNALDSSDYNNHGTVNEAVLATDRFGVTSHAYEFDGVDDSIEAEDSPSLDIDSEITLSAWINPDQRKTQVYRS